MRTLKYLAVLAGVAGLVSTAFATPIVKNGDFELIDIGGSFQTVYAGQNTIKDWQVISGSVDLINTYWKGNPSQSLDMSGFGPGAIRQNVHLDAGKYLVSFDMGGNPAGGPAEKKLEVQISSADKIYSFIAKDNNLPSMSWENHSFLIDVSAGNYDLTFTSLTPTAYGPALDNVKIEIASGGSIPDAGTTLSLLGIGFLGLAGLRRKLS